MANVFMLPGMGGSGPGHWQTLWAAQSPDIATVEQENWDAPNLSDWIDSLHKTLPVSGPGILVAHSVGCALAAHYLSQPNARQVDGVMMVCPAEVDNPERTPEAVRGFAPMPLRSLPCPCVVVASEDDPYVSFDGAATMARAWGGTLVRVGRLGHVNEASGVGKWSAGLAILDDLKNEIRAFD